MRALAVFLFSIGILGSQIVWTRIFSFSIWYHFAFLVISIAMLGFTSGGLALTLRPKLLERPPERVLAGAAIYFSLASLLALVLVINLPISGWILGSVSNVLCFSLLILLLCAQFFWAGLYVAFAISSEPGNVSRIYFANMTGSGLGCAISVYFMNNQLPTGAFLSFALIALGSALVLLPRIEDKRLPGIGAVASLVLLVGSWVAVQSPMAEPFFLKSFKGWPDVQKEQIVERTSNSLAVVDFFRPPPGELTGLWGLSEKEYERDHPGAGIPERVGYLIDSWALTYSYTHPEEITQHPVWDYLPAGLAYHAIQPKDVLIIGAGGGIDLIAALRSGAEDITAVDINPTMIDAGLERFKEWNQGIFHRPGVKPVVAEGRSYLTAADDRKWELIQLSGVDTLAASQAGAFTLSENFLYTTEAFESYLEHLKPGGIATLTRWMYEPPRQTLRVIVVADEALRRRGVQDTSRHFMLVADQALQFSVILLANEPFSDAQVKTVYDASVKRGFVPLVLPGMDLSLPPRNGDGPRPNLFQELARLDADEKQAFIDEYPFDITATTDDKPFFMEHTRWSSIFDHPEFIFSKQNGPLLLIVTTMIVALFALLFITLPARFARPDDAPAGGGKFNALAFFSCLGLAYVLVEIVLVQKLTLYLGNPAYALALVLSSLLVFSGIGAMISGRFTGPAAPRLVMLCGAVAALIVVYVVVLDAFIDATLQMPLGVRMALTLVVLAPPATLMGMPFPTAISALGEARQDLVVGGWVLNGYFSVLASCLAMLISINLGFRVVLLTGALIYAIAAALRPLDRAGAQVGDNA